MKPISTALAALLVSVTAVPIALVAREQGSRGTSGEAAQVTAVSASPFLPPEPYSEKRALHPVVVGERYPEVERIPAPGRYGLFDPPEGESYAIVSRTLVRLDDETGQVLSVLRRIEVD